MKYSRPGWLHPSRLGEGQVIKAETVRARIKELQDCAAVTFGPPLVEGKMSTERGEELEAAVVAYGFDVKMFEHKSSGGWACDCGEYNAPATFCCGRCKRSR